MTKKVNKKQKEVFIKVPEDLYVKLYNSHSYTNVLVDPEKCGCDKFEAIKVNTGINTYYFVLESIKIPKQ